ncbi:MAG: Clp protease ClpP [Halanaerobiales bacterium]|nr:Clp protease ClpP [Halanaerobiales bacterium]
MSKNRVGKPIFSNFNSERKNNKSLFQVFNKADEDLTVIDLYGAIRENPDEESDRDVIALSEVRKEIEKINSSKILCRISTTGGSFFAGSAIANLLREHSAEVTTRVTGTAASAGSIIFLAGENREMYKNTSLLIHRVRAAAFGDWETLENAAENLKQLDNSLIENYKEFFNGTENKLREILADDKFMTAQKAKEYGFCTHIIDDTAEDDSEIENSVNGFYSRNKSRYNNFKTRPDIVNSLMKKYGDKTSSNDKNLFKKFN